MKGQPGHRFAYRLALELGMTVREMLQRMDSHEFAEWQAFYEVEPFGATKDDLFTARLLCFVANMFRGKDELPAEIEDFLLLAEKPDRRQSVETQLLITQSLVRK
mgnify:CR=1 FL=1